MVHCCKCPFCFVKGGSKCFKTGVKTLSFLLIDFRCGGGSWGALGPPYLPLRAAAVSAAVAAAAAAAVSAAVPQGDNRTSHRMFHALEDRIDTLVVKFDLATSLN